MLSVLLAAAVPLKVRVLSLVMPSPTVPLSDENELMVGAPGAPVSTVTLRGLEAAPWLPPASRAAAPKRRSSAPRVLVVKLQAPLPLAVAVPSRVAPS